MSAPAIRPPTVLSVLAVLLPLATLAAIVALAVALAAGAGAGDQQAGLVVALAISLGVLLALTCAVIHFYAGSSIGSWRKNEWAPPRMPPPSSSLDPNAGVPAFGHQDGAQVGPARPEHGGGGEKPPPTDPPPLAGARTLTLRGKVSHFGGPDDRGVKPDEGLALIEPDRLDQHPALKALMLPAQPPGTTGLARRLDPAKCYIACRWDYAQTPKAWLRIIQVTVRANGRSAQAQPIDWGPAASTGRVADLSPGLMAALGIATDDVCEVVVPLPAQADAGKSTQPAQSDLPGGPPWLARATALRGLYEHAGSADNPAILQMARICGGQIAAAYKHDAIAWCALFVNYCLVASGAPGNDSLWALDFARYGRRLSGPAVGAIASKKRAGGGHVFLVLGRDSSGRIVGIGGNQSDMVCDDEFDAEAIVAYAWPDDYPPPAKVGASMTDVSVLPVVTAVPRARRDLELPA